MPDAVADEAFLSTEFTTTIQTRGAAVIKARQLSSAMSAANAIGDHLRTWLVAGSAKGDFVSLAVVSDGSYGIEEGLVFSFPVTCPGDGTYAIVQDLPLNDKIKRALAATEAELKEEMAAAKEILGVE